MKNIDHMHKVYGIDHRNRCKDCCNLVSHTRSKTWYKCIAFGVTNGEQTDWRIKVDACGLFNVPFDEDKQIPLSKTIKRNKKPVMQIDGQAEFDF